MAEFFAEVVHLLHLVVLLLVLVTHFLQFGDDLMLEGGSLLQLVLQVVHATILSAEVLIELLELALELADLLLEHVVFTENLLVLLLEVLYKLFLSIHFLGQQVVVVGKLFNFILLVPNHILEGHN